MDIEKRWSELYGRLSESIERRRNAADGTQNYYHLQGLREVQEWMKELGAPALVARSSGEIVRIVHGTGSLPTLGEYEVVRYPRAKEYKVETRDGKHRRKITLADAVSMSQEPILGAEGGTAFDKAWHALNG